MADRRARRAPGPRLRYARRSSNRRTICATYGVAARLPMDGGRPRVGGLCPGELEVPGDLRAGQAAEPQPQPARTRPSSAGSPASGGRAHLEVAERAHDEGAACGDLHRHEAEASQAERLPPAPLTLAWDEKAEPRERLWCLLLCAMSDSELLLSSGRKPLLLLPSGSPGAGVAQRRRPALAGSSALGGVDAVDDLGVAAPFHVDRGDAEVGVPELAPEVGLRPQPRGADPRERGAPSGPRAATAA